MSIMIIAAVVVAVATYILAGDPRPAGEPLKAEKGAVKRPAH